jgi:hypothetical protein
MQPLGNGRKRVVQVFGATSMNEAALHAWGGINASFRIALSLMRKAAALLKPAHTFAHSPRLVLSQDPLHPAICKPRSNTMGFWVGTLFFLALEAAGFGIIQCTTRKGQNA